MTESRSNFGKIVCLCGLLIEACGVASMGSYPLRRRLPFRSPIVLMNSGVLTFIAGLAIIGLASTGIAR